MAVLQRQLADLRLLRSSLRDAHRRAAGVDAEAVEHVEKALLSTERKIDQAERDLAQVAA